VFKGLGFGFGFGFEFQSQGNSRQLRTTQSNSKQVNQQFKAIQSNSEQFKVVANIASGPTIWGISSAHPFKLKLFWCSG
jgi:hypothetical protein